MNLFDENSFEDFKLAVANGLNQQQKTLPTPYLYDKKGSELFSAITKHSDYYLTNAELAVLTQHKEKIANLLQHEPFDLVELGPGEGQKTEILIQEFLKQSFDFSYVPIDINREYLTFLEHHFKKKFSYLNVKLIHANYFSGLNVLKKDSHRRKLILFLGSSLGNFDPLSTQQFLTFLRQHLEAGDMFLLGLDICQNIPMLLKAYNDSDGLTQAFNLNLLERINQELKADFNLKQFQHYATYNVYTRAMESYLISLIPQTVHIKSIDEVFHFQAMEPILIECSYKYRLDTIPQLATSNGFQWVRNFVDKHGFFLDTFWLAG